MNNSGEIKNKLKSDFEIFEKSLNGNYKNNFHFLRRNAFEKFINLDFPTSKNEEWKNTNISPIFKHKFKFPLNDILLNVEEIKKFLFNESEFITLVFINGFFSKNLSNISDEDGLLVSNIKSFIASNSINEKLLFDLYNSFIEKNKTNIFSMLSTSFLRDGAFVSIKENTIIKKPIQIVYLTKSDEEIMTQPRNIFLVGKNSQLKIVESYYGISAASYFSNCITEIFCDENSNFEHIKIQNESGNAYHISNTEVELKLASKYKSFNINYGGEISRNNINTIFVEQESEAMLNGLYLAQSNQFIDNHTSIFHNLPNCKSNQLYKGILTDNARAVFNGKIIVQRDAQNTLAFQQNNNLLLSADALINSKPQLEIFADNVKCSHGATVGQLNKDAMFYLRSRGLDENEARKILIYAFASDVVHSISIDEVRNKLENILAQKLLRK